MIQLSNGCRCSELKVHPKNWESSKAPTKKNWYIYYRYYDPLHKDKYPKGKLRIVKGMNGTPNREERQQLVRDLIELELSQIKGQGYNPITSKHEMPVKLATPILPDTPWILALRQAHEKANYNGQTNLDIKSLIKYVEKAANALQMHFLPVSEIRTGYILQILEQCGKIKERWSTNTHNTYVKYLSMLFGQLVQYKSIDTNPVRDVKKKKTIKKLRTILTEAERIKIDAAIKAYDTRFWRFIHIFFHSGSRTTEILRVQKKHVDIEAQKVKYLVLKGQRGEWVERTIKDIALPLWKDAINNCGDEDYIFSRGLQPGPTMIRPEQVNRRWKLHVKKKLKITCDFYSLKHLNTDQTSELLGLELAAAHNSHKTTAITRRYAVKESARVHEKLRGVRNSFLPLQTSEIR